MEVIKLKDVDARFVNVVKITQVEEFDYLIHFFNSYSGERWVFKVYKALFDKGMEIRRTIKLQVITSEEEKEEKEKDKDKKEESNGVRMIYS